LGDNIFEEDLDVSNFTGGARIFLKEVHDPERYGVATIEGERVLEIQEKPKVPASNYAVSGFYIYDSTVYKKIREVVRSARGELEITDVNNAYIKDGSMEARFVEGFWTDAGTVPSLYHASTLIKQKYESQ
jgi:glucose-1-phosphate thymidylyltransferase